VDEKMTGTTVNIMAEREITTYPKLGQAAQTVAVTYSTLDLAPRTLWIPKDEYTEEERDRRIKQDIERRRTRIPKTITV